MSYSIYLVSGEKVTPGPDGKPYETEASAMADVKARNARAEKMGVSARYTHGAGYTPPKK